MQYFKPSKVRAHSVSINHFDRENREFRKHKLISQEEINKKLHMIRIKNNRSADHTRENRKYSIIEIFEGKIEKQSATYKLPKENSKIYKLQSMHQKA